MPRLAGPQRVGAEAGDDGGLLLGRDEVHDGGAAQVGDPFLVDQAHADRAHRRRGEGTGTGARGIPKDVEDADQAEVHIEDALALEGDEEVLPPRVGAHAEQAVEERCPVGEAPLGG